MIKKILAVMMALSCWKANAVDPMEIDWFVHETKTSSTKDEFLDETEASFFSQAGRPRPSHQGTRAQD
jgi:hypothetical protein